MRIEELELENFNGILHTMETNYLRLDLRNQKNKICLITGPNGHGKTVLLSQLNPFATLGNLDVRDNLPLIIPNKKGRKRIIISYDNNEYEIIHYYTPSKDSHTVKSYIKKNGEELNINGNVTTFKELVKQELDMEPEYMKLVRLGNNVTNMIDLKSTDRKTFMSKLLDELNVYLKYYKKVNADVLEMKTIISHLVNKEKTLGVVDISTVDENINNLVEKINFTKKEIELIHEKIGAVNHELHKLPSESELVDIISDCKKKLKKAKDSMHKSTEELQKEITKLSNDVTIYMEKHRDRIEWYDESIQRLESFMEDLEKTTTEYKKLVSGRDLNALEDIIESLEKEIAEKKKYFKPYGDITYRKENIDELMLFLKEKQDTLTTTYQFGKGPVSNVIKLMRKKENVLSYIEQKIMDLDKNSDIQNARTLITSLIRKYSELGISCQSSESCVAYNVFHDLSELSKDKTKKVENEKEYYSYMHLAYLNIKNVILSFSEKKSLFEKLPKGLVDDFLYDTILDKIESMQWIYDRDKLYDELAFITDYENFLKLQDTLKEKEEELEQSKKDSYLIHLTERIRSLKRDTKEQSEKTDSLREDIATLEEEMKNSREKLELLTSEFEVLTKREELENILTTSEEDIEKRRLYSKDLVTFENRLKALQFDLQSFENSLKNEEYRKSEYLSIHKELELFKEEYDKEVLVRDAISTKEGIPLMFIDLYLSKAKKIVNELLDEIYDGKIYIDKFDIRADRFDIPFVKNNRLIEDIRYASQGEKSFLSIVLSFALAFQSMSSYNIMLLDELDSVLDEKNRAGFIAVVEKLIDMIGAEQIFIISHNNMFSMYPVDAISVIDDRKDDGRMINYIPLEKLAI